MAEEKKEVKKVVKKTTTNTDSKKNVKTTDDKKEEKKVATKKTSETKEPTKTVEIKTPTKATEKKPTTKTATKKTDSKTTKKTSKKVETKKPVKLVFDPRTGKMVRPEAKKAKPVEKKKEEPKEEPKKKKSKAKPKVPSKQLTIEPVKQEPVEVVRPTPKKVKELSKEEKVVYKQLMENFTFVANMAMVIEDRTMDRKEITDLTIGELHVVETVNHLNNKPMTMIARAEHVTVGALTICVNRLVQKGYLLRTRHEMDRRIILLSVTPKAKKVLKAHDKFHENVVGLALEHVSLAKANEVMTKFADMLEYYYDPVGYEAKQAELNKKKKK